MCDVTEVPTYDIPIFDIAIWLVLEDTPEKLAALLDDVTGRENKHPFAFAGGVFAHEHEGRPIYVICILQTGDTTGMLGTLAHEAFHVVEAALTVRGVPYGKTTREVYAYLLGYIVNMLSGELLVE